MSRSFNLPPMGYNASTPDDDPSIRTLIADLINQHHVMPADHDGQKVVESTLVDPQRDSNNAPPAGPAKD